MYPSDLVEAWKNICLRCLVVLQTWCEFYCWNFKKEVFKEDVRKRNDEYIYQNKLLVMTAICFTVHPLFSESVCNICMILCAWNSPHPKNCYFDWKKICFQYLQNFCHSHVNYSKIWAIYLDNLHMAICMIEWFIDLKRKGQLEIYPQLPVFFNA